MPFPPFIHLSHQFPIPSLKQKPSATEAQFAREMCPLRFILVFFSAVLAGYLAWRSLRSQSPEEDFSGDLISAGEAEKVNLEENDDEGKRSLKRIARDGFWVFVNMASGRYLWRNFKEMKTDAMEKKGS